MGEHILTGYKIKAGRMTRPRQVRPRVGWAKAIAVPIKGVAAGPMGTRCFAHPTG